MKKVGCFGGSFDPIHNGHLELAKHVLKECSLDEIWFIPTLDTPLKDRKVSSFSLRERMIQEAIEPYHQFKCCSIEKELGVPSYTINTVKELIKRYENISFSWIVGDDQYQQFHLWKDIDELFELVKFIIVHRDNHNIINDQRVQHIADFKHCASSTAVRDGHFEYLPEKVREIVISNELYFDCIVNAHCSKRRAEHIFSMTNICVYLAKAHHVSEHKAFLAGMLHDVTKEMQYDQAVEIIKKYYPEVLNERPTLYHAYTAGIWIKEHLKIDDKEILDAIQHHVKGDGKTKLDKILYLADKLDPYRGYDSSKQLLLASHDLDAGIQLVKNEQKEYLEKKEGIDV